jgi:hypothetical protein
MKFWDRVKKDLQIAVKEGSELFREGKTLLTAEAKRMAEKGPAGMTTKAQKMMKKGVKTAQKGAAALKAEAQRMAQIANLRYQLFRLNEEAQEKFAEIGGQIYDTAAKNQRAFAERAYETHPRRNTDRGTDQETNPRSIAFLKGQDK